MGYNVTDFIVDEELWAKTLHRLEVLYLEESREWAGVLCKSLHRLRGQKYSREDLDRARIAYEDLAEDYPVLRMKVEAFMRDAGLPLEKIPDLCICCGHESVLLEDEKKVMALERLLNS